MTTVTIGALTLQVLKWAPTKPRKIVLQPPGLLATLLGVGQTAREMDEMARTLSYADGSGQLHCTFQPEQQAEVQAWMRQVFDALEGAPPSHYKRKGHWLNNVCHGCFPVFVQTGKGGNLVNLSVDYLKEVV